MELRAVALYPEQMNIYADRGNILFLRRRCEWRGIEFSYAAAGAGEPLDARAHDLIYVGGGQDRDQRIVAEDMVASKRAGLAEAVEDGAVVLAVCGGYQLLGHSYELGDERIPALASPTSRRSASPDRGWSATSRSRSTSATGRRSWPDSRTTAGGLTWATAPSRWGGWSAATATTARTAWREYGART